ncbi:MAG: hypothetical protein NTV00_00015 [Methylococcales bacterium]|nr:hypothetical protein [Methylococcales bacterium]
MPIINGFGGIVGNVSVLFDVPIGLARNKQRLLEFIVRAAMVLKYLSVAKTFSTKCLWL